MISGILVYLNLI